MSQAARSVRGEITRVLALTRIADAQLSTTPKYLATILGLPVRAVRGELEMMAREGLVVSRTHRSGEVLYRWKDRQDDRWAAFRGPAYSTH